MALKNWVEEFEAENDGSTLGGPLQPLIPPGLDDDDQVGRTYMTVSQTANEKAHLPHPRPDKSNGLA